MRRTEQLTRGFGVFLTDEDFETEAAPSQVIAHAAGSVGLNRGVDASGFESALGEVGFDLRGEPVNNCEFAAIHEKNYTPLWDCRSSNRRE